MRFEYSKLTKVLTVAAAVVSIAACGGGGGGGDPVPATEATVNGLAAVGAPVVGAQVVLRCANNVTGQTTTDSEGRWTLEVANPQFPCLATLSNSTSHAGLTLRSLALETGYLNITPLTELVMARAAAQSSLSLDNVDTQGLLTLSSSLETALSDVIAILVAQGFPAGDLAVFTGQFEAVAGDSYDDLLEHIAVSLEDDGKSLDDLVELIAEADPENVPPLPNTVILDAAALSVMPQLNKASLTIEEDSVKLSLEAGTSPIGAFVGSGIGNKAVLQLGGLDGMKLRDFHSMTVDLKGDVAGVTAPPISPYVSLNLTVDLACSTAALPNNPTLADLRARRLILSFDPYYHFIAPSGSNPRLSSDAFTLMTVTPATPGWRVSSDAPSDIGVAITPNYNGSETLEGFDYETYPDACIVSAATGDGGMFRNTQENTCATGAALVPGDPASCAVPYSGALLFLGSSSATEVSNWLVKEVKFFRNEAVEDSAPVARAFRTYRFQ